MAKETEQTTEKSTGANPYTIRKLAGKWIVALVLVLLVFGLLTKVPILPARQTELGAEEPKGEKPPAEEKVTPETYFKQVNNIMKEMKDAGNELTADALKGKIVSQAEYFRRLRGITIGGRDKFGNLTAPSKCKEIYQLFSEYFRYSILSADVAIEGLESRDKEKIRQAEVESKDYEAKADEFYSQAKSKILNWNRPAFFFCLDLKHTFQKGRSKFNSLLT